MTVLMGHPYDDQYCSNASKRRPLSLDLSGNLTVAPHTKWDLYCL
jgi:hypothetical protein